MKLNQIIPPTPSDVSDWSDAAALQQRMAGTVEKLSRMANDVGLAKHVLEFSSDRRKRALARAMAAPLAGDSSVAKAEAEARSSSAYDKELDQLSREHIAAEQTLTEWEVTKLAWQTAQSLLAMQRESVKRI